MSNIHNKYSFEYITSSELLHKLNDDYSDFLKNPTSSRIAINCTFTAWHIHEWVYGEKNININLGEFRKKLYQKCPELKILKDITNGNKHFDLNKKSKIESTGLYKGAFSKGFSDAFDTDHLVVVIDGKSIRFKIIIEKCVSFWNQYFE